VVLAVGEWRRTRAADGLAAFVAGFEVETRIGRVLGPALAERGWHVTGVLGHFGAAVAAGKLLGLGPGELKHALGIAGTQAAGLEVAFGTMCKPLHPGKAAMNGLLAALLAREGFTGPLDVLESPAGLGATFLGRRELAGALEGLGQRFEILENSSKPYAACHLTHATIDAARAIRERWRPAPETIAAVECRVYPFTLQVAAKPSPQTGLQAKFSVAFCAALGLARGDATEGEFEDDVVRDPVLARLTGRVTPQADPALGIGQAAVTVRLTDGRVLEERVKAARGTAENPQTRAELEGKFRRLAGAVLEPDRVARLLEALRGLDAVDDLGEIARLAAGGARG
jgi:2-methylcitrate dehydratase PrpD